MKHPLHCIFSIMLLMAATSVFAQFNYISPLPGSKMKNKQTTIILKNGGFIDQSSLKNNLVSITGTKSGSHTARIVLSDDGKTICIYPQPMFQGDETVSVNVADGFRRKDGAMIQGTSFQFSTHPDHPVQPKPVSDEGTRLLCTNLVPYTLNYTSAAYPADVFYYNVWSSMPNCWARTILTNEGDSVYGQFSLSEGINFGMNKNGYLTYHDANTYEWIMADSGYNVVKTFQMGNGYFSDEHEFQVFPDGYCFMLAPDTILDQDLTVIGGNDSVDVISSVIQELDPSGNVIFEWNYYDHYLFGDAIFWAVKDGADIQSNTQKWDWIHANSIELDYDSTIIISARHADVIKLDLNTGDLLWHWGGPMNEFKFFDDDSDLWTPQTHIDTFYFSGQHDVRRLPNGHITMFNNDNQLNGTISLTPIRSDAKEYVLDEVNKTATLVWHYYHPLVQTFPLAANAMGSMQRLPNGNTFISWGFITQHYDIMSKISEVDSLGNVVWDFLWVPDGHQYAAYRAHKNGWERCKLIADSSLQEDSIGVYNAILSWETNSKISGYILQYKPCSDSTWISIPVSDNNFDLQGLDMNTCYDWRVQSICSIYGDTSTLSAKQQFTTLLGIYISPLDNPLASFELYPNPASGNVETRFTISANQQVEFIIYNLLGGIVKQETLNAHAGTNKVKIDLKDLAAGAYNVELKAGTQTMHHRLVVN